MSKNSLLVKWLAYHKLLAFLMHSLFLAILPEFFIHIGGRVQNTHIVLERNHYLRQSKLCIMSKTVPRFIDSSALSGKLAFKVFAHYSIMSILVG